ncbi:MAG: CDP-alcohol phosphatidyltransferase family protein [Proteobacteria bacterium]|nr:CDP-alcohol phosphatidyltransferase family protein [Pseudomonadota bacterium]
MLDPYVRPLIDPALNRLGASLAQKGVTPNAMTLTGFGFGLCAIVMVSQDALLWAAVFLALNRICDGLDGAVARHAGLSDFGGFLDIVCDFIVYAGVVFAFGLRHHAHLFYASFLVFSFIGPMVSFLAYAIIAAKRDVTTQKRGKKSFYYLGGLCEGTETTFFLMFFCFFPAYFNAMCVVFGVMCWLTTVGRIYTAWAHFGRSENPLKG